MRRELNEELNIEIQDIQPLTKIYHRYEEHDVILDVWLVQSYGRPVVAREKQAIQWVTLEELAELSLPEADIPVLKALSVPDFYVISEEPESGMENFLAAQEKKFQQGVKLFQFRAKTLGIIEYQRYAQALLEVAEFYDVKVMLNTELELAIELNASGVHLTEQRLMAMEKRPETTGLLIGASCHDGLSLARAEALGLDFAVLSPVKATRSHPGAKPLGWEDFDSLVSQVNLPVYALGGMQLEDLPLALKHGARGIAGIRMYLESNQLSIL